MHGCHISTINEWLWLWLTHRLGYARRACIAKRNACRREDIGYSMSTWMLRVAALTLFCNIYFINKTTWECNTPRLYMKTRPTIELSEAVSLWVNVCVNIKLCWSIYWHSPRFISRIWMNAVLANNMLCVIEWKEGPKYPFAGHFPKWTSSVCGNCNSLRNEISVLWMSFKFEIGKWMNSIDVGIRVT